MSLFHPLNLNSMESLFSFAIKLIYDSEIRLVAEFRKMSEAATTPQLASAFSTHVEETQRQIKRLEKIFTLLGRAPARETCATVKSLINDVHTVVNASGDDEVRDAALIAVAQAIEHHEIASYGTLRTWANHLQRHDLANLLQQNLDEEGRADKTFTAVAESAVNAGAAHAL
jgi:ferritin-like metal-binding protein YciE